MIESELSLSVEWEKKIVSMTFDLLLPLHQFLSSGFGLKRDDLAHGSLNV